MFPYIHQAQPDPAVQGGGDFSVNKLELGVVDLCLIGLYRPLEAVRSVAPFCWSICCCVIGVLDGDITVEDLSWALFGAGVGPWPS